MKEQKCENCGSGKLKFEAGVYTCDHCGSTYTAESDDNFANNYFRDFFIKKGVLIDYHGHDDVVEIPEGVTRVAEDAFLYNSLTTLKCPRSLTRFDGSLKKCQKLECFEAPGLTEISGELFYQHATIKKVVLPSVKEIPEEAFYKCENLEEVVFSSAIAVHEGAFYQSGLERITAPKIQTIEDNAFCGCECLENISFPNAQKIGVEAFSSCESIQTAKLPKVKVLGNYAFAHCENLQKVTAPNLEKLGYRGFDFCENLEKVSFPKLQTIGEFAFDNCSALKEVDCNSAVLEPNEKGRYNQFWNCPSLITINLDESVNKKWILRKQNAKGGCYIATCVYGEYDCPQVWTLRRFRDNALAEHWYGRAFIRTYYAISPMFVKWFGHQEWFKKLWKGKLDKLVCKLQSNGFESTPYKDRNW